MAGILTQGFTVASSVIYHWAIPLPYLGWKGKVTSYQPINQPTNQPANQPANQPNQAIMNKPKNPPCKIITSFQLIQFVNEWNSLKWSR